MGLRGGKAGVGMVECDAAIHPHTPGNVEGMAAAFLKRPKSD